MIRVLAVALLALAPVAANAANPINGNFEAGGGSLSGWTVGGDVGALTGAQYSSCCGTFGSEPGFSSNHFASFGSGNVSSTNTITQSFATMASKRYTVSFDYGALGNGSQSIGYSAGGVAGSLTAFANNNIDTTFTNFSFSFIGIGAPTSIGFSVVSSADGVDSIIDNVSVTAVPEPASWALMIGGFGLVGAALRRQRATALA